MINNCTFITQFWLPATCVLCQSPGHDGLDICPACLKTLPFDEHHCPCCGIPLAAPAPLCGQCQQHLPAFDEVQCLAEYRYPVPELVQGLKFRARLSHARLLGELLARKLLSAVSLQHDLPGAIVPVPLHPLRQRQRGFNQALEIARPLSARLAIPLLPDLASRSSETGTQSLLNAKERKRNLKGAFEIDGKPPAHVAIVDDVVTTATTVNELARSLKTAGAKKISVWAVARA